MKLLLLLSSQNGRPKNSVDLEQVKNENKTAIKDESKVEKIKKRTSS